MQKKKEQKQVPPSGEIVRKTWSLHRRQGEKSFFRIPLMNGGPRRWVEESIDFTNCPIEPQVRLALEAWFLLKMDTAPDLSEWQLLLNEIALLQPTSRYSQLESVFLAINGDDSWQACTDFTTVFFKATVMHMTFANSSLVEILDKLIRSREDAQENIDLFLTLNRLCTESIYALVLSLLKDRKKNGWQKPPAPDDIPITIRHKNTIERIPAARTLWHGENRLASQLAQNIFDISLKLKESFGKTFGYSERREFIERYLTEIISGISNVIGAFQNEEDLLRPEHFHSYARQDYETHYGNDDTKGHHSGNIVVTDKASNHAQVFGAPMNRLYLPRTDKVVSVGAWNKCPHTTQTSRDKTAFLRAQKYR